MATQNVVSLFGPAATGSLKADSPVFIVRTLADATVAFGKVAEFIDAGDLDPDSKLALLRGLQDLVVRSFDLNTRFMETVGLARTDAR